MRSEVIKAQVARNLAVAYGAPADDKPAWMVTSVADMIASLQGSIVRYVIAKHHAGVLSCQDMIRSIEGRMATLELGHFADPSMYAGRVHAHARWSAEAVEKRREREPLNVLDDEAAWMQLTAINSHKDAA